MRLIDADALRIKPDFIFYGVCGTPVIRCEDLARIINDMPTIDPQPEIIRCKDCKHRQNPNICPMTFEEWVEIDEGDGCYDSDYILHDNTIDDGFCNRGDSYEN